MVFSLILHQQNKSQAGCRPFSFFDILSLKLSWLLDRCTGIMRDHAVLYDEHSYQLLDELFELLKAVKPYETRREDIVWKLWLRAERGTIDDFGSYEEMRDLGEVEDRKAFAELWKSECPNEVEWYAFQALYVKDIRCKAIMLGHRLVIVLDPRKETGGFEHDRNVCQFFS